MASVENTRRSGRKRKRNNRYTNDAFEGLDLNDLEQEHFPVKDLDSGSDDFAPTPAIEEDIEADEEAFEDEASDSPSVAGEDEDLTILDDDDTVAIDDLAETPNPRKKPYDVKKDKRRGPVPKRRPNPRVDELHSRGLRVANRYASRDVALLDTFGDHDDASSKMLQVQDKWFDEITLPSRTTSSNGKRGMCYSPFVSDEAREIDAKQGWDWFYSGGGREFFQEDQEFRSIDAEEAKHYMPDSVPNRHVIMGPQGEQRLFSLKAGQWIDSNDAWTAKKEGTGSDTGTPVKERSRSGWILNMGEPIQCLGWCPNQDSGKQYLVVAAPNNGQQEEPTRGEPTATAPAFTSSPPYKSALQIWEFRAEAGTGFPRIDMKVPPRLDTVICSDWGHVKQIKWCPSLRQNQSGAVDGERELGLVATLHSDGKVRVLYITLPFPLKEEPRSVHIKQSAWTAKPPDTVCTSMTWITSTHIAAGCANGHIALWDISSIVRSPNEEKQSSREPILYALVQTTYIMGIQSLAPSHPHLIVTTSASGHHSLTSLQAPYTDNVQGPRARVGTSAFIWHEQTQHAVFAEESQAIRAHNVRQFWQSVMLTHQEALTVSMAGSPAHSAILLGGADGTCTVYNPVRRIMHRRSGGDHYRQRWFKHEWRRGKPTPQAEPVGDATVNVDADGDVAMDGTIPTEDTNASGSAPAKLDFPTGLARLTTGFAIEPLSDRPPGPYKSSDRKGKGRKPTTKAKKPIRVAEDGSVYTTIHDPESGVRAVDWNPNLHVGGWAAAGCGDGLVVVEDLCWD